tara:strand:+ start:675 stop:1010 length:336 start_codon:yes stop_codon:yes gene_type:complete
MIEYAIQKINPNAAFSIEDDDIDQITWLNGTTPISKEDIQAQLPTVEFELSLEDLRQKRNALLAETDYFALSDVTMSSEMQTYRQSLRDITDGLTTVDEVNSVTFPTKPGE